MLGALDLFNGTLGLIVAVIADFIARAVRLINGALAMAPLVGALLRAVQRDPG